MSCVNLFIKRGISTSCARFGKRNFRKFPIYNKRGSKIFKEMRKDPNYDLPHDKRGLRDVGYYADDGTFVLVPEKIPELIVPDLKDFPLKPYVSYRTPDVMQSEFTAEDLFNVVYAPKIAKDFKEGKLNEDGTPLEPSPEERMTPEEARIKAEQTGSDIF
ncbi:large ribosomal subunit protein mL41 [Tribolium castaneum]|uniref:39S ribosomal protein L41, mitochondrial-like Protein n=1 Tax=Tribolium castaneum TaxID=7070 RepID=D2A065_TRICA|nr:PREDICTED: 39S ribosomal protein L41, mitochondrial [Tribolium castaneum]EFA02474.1 39S ribosomal protein L41, mitochondrial-like Protein [Tribolium castaneum]|eukprot:XP_975525.1 PREDICTED: 39S ribosomal protein L41, mitochondrial [Tribolium castaneum]